MAYEKQIWANGDVITAEKLNHIEDGITSNNAWIIEMTLVQDGYDVYLSSTAQWDDVVATVCSGRTVMIKLPNTEESRGYSIAGSIFPILGYSPEDPFGNDPALLFNDGYGGGSVGTFQDFYKSNDGYLYGHVYID